MKRYLVRPGPGDLRRDRQAWAHHSFAATYIENQSVTIEGELVQFGLRNPHSFVNVDVTEKDGSTTRLCSWNGRPCAARRQVDPKR